MRAFLRFTLAVAVSAFVLALLLHVVGGGLESGASRLLEVLRAANVALLVAYVGCQAGQILWRTLRYGLLLRAAGERSVPRFGHMLLVTMCRNMFVDLLPARVGELSYVAMLNRGYSVGAEACVSSLGISVLFDFVALFFIVAGLLLVQLVSGQAPLWLLYVTGILLVVILSGLGIVFVAYGGILRKLQGLRLRMPKVMGFLDRLSGAIDATRRAGVFARTLGLSLLVRGFKYGGYYLAFLAIAQASFPDMAAVPFWKVLFTLVSSEAASSAPMPTFMSFGSYETGGTAMWAVLGFPAADAAVSTLALHVVSQVVDYSIGGLGLLLFTFLVPSRAAAAPAWRRGLAVATTAAVAVGALGFFWFEKREISKRGAIEPPPAGQDVASPSTLDTRHPGPRGFIVWSSNRSGNHDIWRMDLPDGPMTQVTTNPHSEYYPRISPDGKRIAFCRGHAPWVSQRNHLMWDVYTRDLETGVETLVASNSIDPVWTADGRFLVYVSGETNVIRHNLATGEPLIIAASGELGVPAGAIFSTPDFNEHNAQVAATLRGATRMTALVSPDIGCRKVGGGCQLAWSPDDAFLYLVDHGGHMKNAVWKIDPATGTRTMLFDQPGPWSHEYFPKLSADGRWMVFGAAAEGHEHDTADYELFLWEVGSDPASATRLTWHTGNDCWPDIYVTGAR